jgi:hypothetical protein
LCYFPFTVQTRSTALSYSTIQPDIVAHIYTDTHGYTYIDLRPAELSCITSLIKSEDGEVARRVKRESGIVLYKIQFGEDNGTNKPFIVD